MQMNTKPKELHRGSNPPGKGEQMNLNIHEFAKLYSDSYSWLYEQDSTGEFTQEFAWTFTELMHKNKSFKRFVQDFVRYRGDFITSDREAAAFVLTMDRMREGCKA